MANTDDLSGPLSTLLRRAEASYPDRAHKVWEVWEESVGPDVAKRSYPLSFRRGRLVVAVSAAAWMQELSFLRELIRDSLNRALGADLVTDIRLRVAEAEPPPAPRTPAPPPPWLSETLPGESLEKIERELSTIRDPELRDAIRQVRVRAEQVRRFREDRAEAPPPPSSASQERAEKEANGPPGPRRRL